MPTSVSGEDPNLNELAPTETAGRETIARYRAQFQAAAYECLAILGGQTIDRVYCDFHDDFVTRLQDNGKPIYHFYQVKTKGKKNYQWNKHEIFGLLKKQKSTPTKIAESFAGKLLLHTTRFNNACGNVVLLTNIQIDEEVEAVASDLDAGNFSNKNIVQLVDAFNDAFVSGKPLDESQIKERLTRLKLKPGALHLEPYSTDFEALAREAIFEYSEVDLGNLECKEIIADLISLVQRKSSRKAISQMSAEDLDDVAGIGISDLLEILSISSGAYKALVSGGDPKAVLNASIIQRKMTQAGASEQMVEYCSRCKVEWDLWLREKRHMLAEFDLNFLLEAVNTIKNGLATGQIGVAAVQARIDALWAELSLKGLSGTLTKDLLLGGVFSALVRSES